MMWIGALQARLATTAGKIAAVVLAIVLLLGILQVRSCNADRQAAAEARVHQAQAEAMSNSAADAIAVTGEAGRRETQSETLTRTNEREIRNAEGANDAVNPAVRDAGLRSLCKRAAYRDTERCRLLGPVAPGVAPGR